MTKKLSIAVQMHPDRAKFTEYLTERLGDVPIITERGLGYWDTFRRCWLAYDPDAQFHAVIQDDALVCVDFRARAEAALQEDMPHSFYWGNRVGLRPLAEQGMAVGYVDDKLHWSLAMCLPTRLIDQFVAFGDTFTPDGLQMTHLKIFLKRNRILVRHTMPSLVDHRDSEPSLINQASAVGRRAYCFIDGRDD